MLASCLLAVRETAISTCPYSKHLDTDAHVNLRSGTSLAALTLQAANPLLSPLRSHTEQLIELLMLAIALSWC